MVRFYIVRHGQTLLNSLDRAQGWTDSPLTEAGKPVRVLLLIFCAAWRLDVQPIKKPASQSRMAFSTGIMPRPNEVREYSVLGGLYFPLIKKSVASTGQLNWSLE